MSKEVNEFTPVLKLLDCVMTTTEIRCDRCDKTEKCDMDEWEAAEKFLDEGWEIKGEKCLCKSCNSKKS